MKILFTFSLLFLLLAGCGQSELAPSSDGQTQSSDGQPAAVDEPTEDESEPGVLADSEYVTVKRDLIFAELFQREDGVKPRPPLPRFSFVDITDIISGDTIEVRTHSKERLLVRLTGIDSPEIGQPWGEQARHFVNERIAGKHLPIICTGMDDTGFPSVNVLQQPGFLNLQLVSAGLAWYSRDHERHEWMDPYETAARNAQLGLWGDSREPIPPWEWRQSGETADPDERAEPLPDAPARTRDNGLSALP